MRTVLSIFAAFALMLGTLRECVVIFSFTLNRPYIAKNLCEKRDQPGNTCQGSCQLCKQLNNDDQTDHNPPARNLTELDDLQPVPLAAAFRLFTPGSIVVPGARSAVPIPDPLSDQIDHPPRFILA